MNRRVVPPDSVILLLALACSGEPDPQTCPAKATSCPSGCDAILGSLFDPVGNCVGPSLTIACKPAGGSGGNTQVGCARDDAQGTLYWLGSTSDVSYLAGTGEWSACGAVLPSKLCK